MKKLSLLIFTDCGSDIGFGHLNRCLSIKSEFIKMNVEVLLEIFDDRGVTSSSDDWLNHWPEIIENHSPTHVLVDSFRVDESFFERLASLKLMMFVIDDYPERNHTKGTVINWTVGAEVDSFLPRHPEVRYLLGSKYCCLRPAFAKPANINTFDKSTILVTFGGSDIRNLSLPIVRHICTTYPMLNVNLVLGQGVNADDFSKMSNVNIHYNCSAEEMCDLMSKAQFALCGGGQTLYEMASRGLPPIIISLIDNQLADIHGFVDRGFGLSVGSWDDADLLDSLNFAINEMMNPQTRHIQANKGVTLVDGLGAERLVMEILKQ